MLVKWVCLWSALVASNYLSFFALAVFTVFLCFTYLESILQYFFFWFFFSSLLLDIPPVYMFSWSFLNLAAILCNSSKYLFYLKSISGNKCINYLLCSGKMIFHTPVGEHVICASWNLLYLPCWQELLMDSDIILMSQNFLSKACNNRE